MNPVESYKQKVEARANTCMSCEHKDGNRCGICGCFLSLKSLAFWSQCPDKRWPE